MFREEQLASRLLWVFLPRAAPIYLVLGDLRQGGEGSGCQGKGQAKGSLGTQYGERKERVVAAKKSYKRLTTEAVETRSRVMSMLFGGKPRRSWGLAAGHVTHVTYRRVPSKLVVGLPLVCLLPPNGESRQHLTAACDTRIPHIRRSRIRIRCIIRRTTAACTATARARGLTSSSRDDPLIRLPGKWLFTALVLLESLSLSSALTSHPYRSLA